MELTLEQNLTQTAPVALRGASLPLSMVPTGKTVRVARVRGKEGFTRHLANLGFVEGAEVRVVNQVNGDTIVNVKGSQLGLDRDTARRIVTA